MFGYIIPLKNELKVKDFDKFRTYYCSICYEIKNKFGNIPRLGLNYDTTFFCICKALFIAKFDKKTHKI